MIRLGIRVRPERAEIALARLLPVLAGGAEERTVDGSLEYAVYAPAGELPAVDEIRALAGDALVDLVHEPVADGWDRRWHEFVQPVSVGPLTIRPPWVEGAAGDVVIDPGLCFGTGSHPTTRLALRLLLDAKPGGALCDWGAGTGVLAIAGARLGFGPVTAVEIDRGALATIEANVAANRVDVTAVPGDLAAAAWAPTVVANLTRELLVAAAARVEPPARLLASGFLREDADEVVAAWGMRETRRIEEDGWAGVVLE